MNTMSIIPNGPLGIKIVDDNLISYIIKMINFHYNVKGKVQIFPGPQPVSVEKKDLYKLTNFKYNVGLKLDGTRFLMYFFTHNNKNMCVLINRALEIFTIDIDVNLYSGTLLDGELCHINDKWQFIIHDCVLLNNNKISYLKHNERLNNVKKEIENNNSELFILLKVKTFYSFDNFDEFINKEYENDELKNDGIIFMPNGLPVTSGTQYSMLKWKPHNKHTFDFLIKEDGDSFEACVYHLKNITIFAKIHNTDNNGTIFINKTKSLENYKNECILECDFKDNNFVPILIRTDKTHPNSLRTIERTLFNINENIMIKDFKDCKV